MKHFFIKFVLNFMHEYHSLDFVDDNPTGINGLGNECS